MSNARPRRRSIFGGVLFIALGTLFLVANLRPEIRLWAWFADYWPVLLILWGLSKLFDYFAAQRAGEPAPRSLRGGEIFLIILLVIVGLSAAGTHRFISQNPEFMEEFEGFGNPYSYTEEVVQPAKPGSQISINTDRGDIIVQPEDISEVRVQVKKSARAFEAEDAERRAKSVRVVIQEVPGGYEILPKVDSDNQRGVRVDLEVHIPKKSNVKAKTERGDIRISGVQGSVSVNSARGDVEIRNTLGEVTVEMRRGDVRVVDSKGKVRISGRGSEIEVSDVAEEAFIQGEFYGPIRVKNVAKEVHFLSQRTDMTVTQLPGRLEMGGGTTEVYDTPGNISLVTRERDVVLENVSGRIKVGNRRGDVKVLLRQAPTEPLDISNESASVELAMPANSTFEMIASSRQGEVESDFEGPELKLRSDEKNSALEGRLGARGPKIQVRTTYGSVRIRKID